MKDAIKTFRLPAGTVCKRGGIPFELAQDTEKWGCLCEPQASLLKLEVA